MGVGEHGGAEREDDHDDDGHHDLEADVSALALLLGDAARPLLELFVARSEEAVVIAVRVGLRITRRAFHGAVVVIVRILRNCFSGIAFSLGVDRRAIGDHVEARHVDRREHLRGLGRRSLGHGAHRALVVDARGVREMVRLVGNGRLKCGDGLRHLAARDIGLAQICVELVLHRLRHIELERALIGRDRIRRTIESHEANTQVEQRLRGIGIALVKRGLAKRDARLCGLAHLHVGVAHADVGLVTRVVSLVGHCGLKIVHRVVVVVERRICHAEIAVDRALHVVGGIGHGLRVGLDGLVGIPQLDQAVADLVVQTPRLARRRRHSLILQALRERHERALEILGVVERLRFVEKLVVHLVPSIRAKRRDIGLFVGVLDLDLLDHIAHAELTDNVFALDGLAEHGVTVIEEGLRAQAEVELGARRVGV